MELEMSKKRGRFIAIAGLLSFLTALLALAGLNISLLLDSDEFPDFFLVKLPIVGIILGLIGLVTKGHSRLYSIWGIGLCLFIYIFTFMMFGLAWTINPKP
ncbi:hypothetical protein [Robertmurraya sp. Marseille-Q9965]